MDSTIRIAKFFVDKARQDEANCNGVSDMTPLKLNKISYIAHGWVLGFTSKPLLIEDVEAWEFGPVIPELYRGIRIYKRNPIKDLDGWSEADLNEREKNLLDQVYDIYGKFHAGKLVGLTHEKGTPWYEVTNGGKKYGRGIVIPNESIERYYKRQIDDNTL